MPRSSSSSETFFSEGHDDESKRKKKKGASTKKDKKASKQQELLREELDEEIATKIAEGISKALQRPDVIRMITDATIISFKKALALELEPLNAKIGEIHDALTKDEESLAQLRTKVVVMEKELVEFRAQTANKEKLAASINALSDRRNNVVITGITEGDTEEKCEEEIKSFADKIGCTLGSLTARRLGKKREDGQPRSVLVQLASFWDKRKLMATRMSLRAAGFEKVFINEDLTKDQASLFFEARQARKTNDNIKSTWTENGIIYIRVVGQPSPQQISSKEELAPFLNNGN